MVKCAICKKETDLRARFYNSEIVKALHLEHIKDLRSCLSCEKAFTFLNSDGSENNHIETIVSENNKLIKEKNIFNEILVKFISKNEKSKHF